jgi:hypothetical protein
MIECWAGAGLNRGVEPGAAPADSFIEAINRHRGRFSTAWLRSMLAEFTVRAFGTNDGHARFGGLLLILAERCKEDSASMLPHPSLPTPPRHQ